LKRLLIVVTAVVLLSLAGACAHSAKDQGASQANGSPEMTSTRVASPTYPPMTTSTGLKPAPGVTVTSPSFAADGSGTNYTGSSSTPIVPDNRMIVRTGNISIVVDDINAALNDIEQLAIGYKGYVVSSNSWKNGEQIFGTISIRVPAESYDIATKSVGQMAVEVTSQSSSSQDVTAEYVDLGAQLSSLQATEQQLLLIMSKADKVADILAVQTQLTQVQTQIEQIKGQMQYLEKTSSTSLINVSLSQSKLEAKFSASSVNAKTGSEIQFYPDIAGGFTPYSYEWDFGDGKTSTDASPTHIYAKPGTFTISLKVTDDRANTVTETRENYIKVTQGGWSIGGVASGAWSALLWLGRGIVTIVIGLGIFSPVIIIIGGLIWLLVRRKKAKAA
jgi:PKD repeat protein